jgi:hypothetical protein
MDATAARLSAHKNTNLVTREQIAALPAVVGTDSFKPIPHIELIVSLENVLNQRGIQIAEDNQGLKKEQFAIGKDGLRLFGTMDLTLNGIGGTCASLGLRTANNKTMALQMIAGLRVFVCDNMAFSGDTIMLKRRHTSGLNLMGELAVAMTRYEQHYATLKGEVDMLKTYELTETAAKVILHDVFAQQIMPVRFFPEVSETYFDKYVNAEEPRYAAFRDRSAWSLLNSFTDVAQAMPLTTRIKATQLVGKLFGDLVK